MSFAVEQLAKMARFHSKLLSKTGFFDVSRFQFILQNLSRMQ